MGRQVEPTTEVQDYRRRPDPIPFSQFLYNSEKGTVLGRTGSSWGKECILIVVAAKFVDQEHYQRAIRRVNTHTTSRVS